MTIEIGKAQRTMVHKDDLMKVCKALDECEVEYIIVGGTAVALHGFYRNSIAIDGKEAEKPDLDFWYNPTYGNYFKLLKALEYLGRDVTRYKAEKRVNPKESFFRYDLENFTLDFLPKLKGPLNFNTSYDRRETVCIDDIIISFMSYEDLIIDKEANARPKDINDIKELENRRKNDQK